MHSEKGGSPAHHKVFEVQHGRQAVDGVGLQAERLQPLRASRHPRQQHAQRGRIVVPAPCQIQVGQRSRDRPLHGCHRGC